MSKRSSLALCLVATALATFSGLAPASAETFWVPSPKLGSGKAKIHLETSREGARRIEVSFVATGRSAAGLNGSRVSVDNDEKPNVFNASRFVTGVGMLRLVNDPGPNLRSGTLFLSARNDDLAWPAPVITNDNWFQGDEVAYLQGMARNASGHANIEIMNFGTQAAVCSIQLRRADGTALGAPTSATLLPLSHEVVEDPFEEIAATGAGLRAEVDCDQSFYAYGTFVGATGAAGFRMHYPLSVPPEDVVETLEVVRNGVFFTPTNSRGDLDLPLPLVPQRAYRRVTVDFDVFVRRFTPLFTGLVGMVHAGGQRFNRTLYYGTFVRGNRAKTLVDLGSAIVEPALRVSSPWKQNTLHHVTIVYDSEAATTEMKVTQGTQTILNTVGGAYNLDIADRGQPVRLVFGLKGVADNAYFPPVGWRFSNLKVKIER